MRRFRSTAYRDYVSWAEKARKPMQKATDAHKAGDDTWRYLVCSVVILTHAEFEAYFSAIVHYLAAEINSRKLSAAKLPGHVWGAMLSDALPHDELKHFYVFDNERYFFEKLEKRLTHAKPPAMDWHQSKHVGLVSPEVLMGGKSNYPTFERLHRVFHKIAKINFRSEISKRIGGDPELVIEEFGGLRGSMAHTGLPAGVSIPDVEAKIKRLSKLIKAIDDMVIAEIVGKAIPR